MSNFRSEDDELVMVDPTTETIAYWSSLNHNRPLRSNANLPVIQSEVNFFENGSALNSTENMGRRSLRRRLNQILENSGLPDELRRKVKAKYLEDPDLMDLSVDKVDPDSTFMFDLASEKWFTAGDLERDGCLKSVHNAEFDRTVFENMKMMVSMLEYEKDFESSEPTPLRMPMRSAYEEYSPMQMTQRERMHYLEREAKRAKERERELEMELYIQKQRDRERLMEMERQLELEFQERERLEEILREKDRQKELEKEIERRRLETEEMERKREKEREIEKQKELEREKEKLKEKEKKKTKEKGTEKEKEKERAKEKDKEKEKKKDTEKKEKEKEKDKDREKEKDKEKSKKKEEKEKIKEKEKTKDKEEKVKEREKSKKADKEKEKEKDKEREGERKDPEKKKEKKKKEKEKEKEKEKSRSRSGEKKLKSSKKNKSRRDSSYSSYSSRSSSYSYSSYSSYSRSNSQEKSKKYDSNGKPKPKPSPYSTTLYKSKDKSEYVVNFSFLSGKKEKQKKSVPPPPKETKTKPDSPIARRKPSPKEFWDSAKISSGNKARDPSNSESDETYQGKLRSDGKKYQSMESRSKDSEEKTKATEGLRTPLGSEKKISLQPTDSVDDIMVIESDEEDRLARLARQRSPSPKKTKHGSPRRSEERSSRKLSGEKREDAYRSKRGSQYSQSGKPNFALKFSDKKAEPPHYRDYRGDSKPHFKNNSYSSNYPRNFKENENSKGSCSQFAKSSYFKKLKPTPSYKSKVCSPSDKADRFRPKNDYKPYKPDFKLGYQRNMPDRDGKYSNNQSNNSKYDPRNSHHSTLRNDYSQRDNRYNGVKTEFRSDELEPGEVFEN